MRREPSFAPLFLFVLFLVHGAGLLLSVRMLPQVRPGKAIVPLAFGALVAVSVYALLLWANFRSIRAGTTAAGTATRRGITLVVVGATWAAASLAIVLNESTSILLGLFAMGGMLLWYPLLLAGVLFLLAVRRDGFHQR